MQDYGHRVAHIYMYENEHHERRRARTGQNISKIEVRA